MSWWVDLGYPSFEEGRGGFPRTGQVIKHYRENKLDDAGKAWTQIRLAKELKITDKAVGEIENLDTNIDVDRRERLCQLFDIPAILLGIRTREEILKMVEERRAKQATAVVSATLSSLWWIELGYPPFAPGNDGFFPRTGQVVKYYRGLAMDTKSKLWTQKGLAKALGLESDQTVWDLETKDTALDFERRQFLCKVFDIPPILFGIITPAEIDWMVEQQRAARTLASVVSAPFSPARKSALDTLEYQEYLVLCRKRHATEGSVSMTPLLSRIDALYRELPHSSREQRPEIHNLLCDYHRFVAAILRNGQRYVASLEHTDKALLFADELRKAEMRAICLLDRGHTFRDAERFEEAVQAFEEARLYEKGLSSYLDGSLLLYAGPAYAGAARTERERSAAIALLDRGGNIVRAAHSQDSSYLFDFSLERYHLNKGAALVAIGWNREAIRELDLVEGNRVWWQAYKHILQAQAYTNLGHYSKAANLAALGLVLVQGIDSKVNIARVESIYKQFPQDLFKRDPDVARLDYLLHYKPRKGEAALG